MISAYAARKGRSSTVVQTLGSFPQAARQPDQHFSSRYSSSEKTVGAKGKRIGSRYSGQELIERLSSSQVVLVTTP
jgi:hypothetical protein